MVRMSEQEQESYRSRLFNFKWRNNDNNNAARHDKSLSVETGLDEAATGSDEAEPLTIIHPSKGPPLSRSAADEAALAAAVAREKQLLADMEQMKERFSKLLLGEDNSGGGKGVSSALALSNAITNLAASVFGEQRRLEPMPAERKARWRKEIDWLLSVSDYVVEFAPSQQKNKDGTNMEIMTTRQRTDLHMNIPALKKLDAMLIDCLFVKIQNGRASLGDQMYKNITVDFFDPDQFLSSMDMSSEHKIVDLKNRMEASIVIWKRKMVYKDSKSSAPWASGVSLEKREVFEERAETILLILKQRYPGISQSALDISKIQFNKDVGQAVLESYSRILESLAYTVLSRIDDVLEADRAVNKRSTPMESEDETLVGSMTLSDFMGWDFDQGNADLESKKDISDDQLVKEKLSVVTTKKTSYLETLGGVNSPTARH